jgi:hypothetical protein
LDHYKQAKQSQYIKRHRNRLDAFIRARIPRDWSHELLRLTSEFQRQCENDQELVWDYVEFRELVLLYVTEHVAKDIFAELKEQFWFDERWLTLDAIGERCLSFMIIGEKGAATGF